MITLRANDIRRLNVILRLPSVKVDALDEAGWNRLLDDLYFSVFGEKTRVFRQDAFHWGVTKPGVRAAQEGLRAQLPTLRRLKLKDPAPEFKLSAQTLYIAAGNDGFLSKYLCDDCPTMVYSTLAYLLERSKVRQRDIRTCANDRCETVFIPLRRPHKRQKSYCSQKCGGLIAARKYRRNHATELRAKETDRKHQRYVKAEQQASKPK